MEEDGDLFATIGVTAQSAEQVEQRVLDEAVTQQDQAGAAGGDGDQAEQLQEQLLTVQEEVEALEAVLAAQQEEQQQEEEEPADWASDDEDEGAAAGQQSEGANKANRLLEQAVMAERLAELQQRGQELQTALHALQQQPQPQQQQQAQQEAGAPVEQLLQQGQQQQQRSGKGGLIETERDRLIRLGVLTPFDRLQGYERKVAGAPPAAAATTATPSAAAMPSAAAGAAAGSLSVPDLAPSTGMPVITAAGTGQAAANADTRRADAAGPSTAQQQQQQQLSRSGVSLEELLARTSQRSVQIAATRPTTVLMGPALVPKQESELRKVNPLFWQKAASRSRVAEAANASAGPMGQRPKRASTLSRKRKSHAKGFKHSKRHKRRREPKSEGEGLEGMNSEGVEAVESAVAAPKAKRRRRRLSGGVTADDDDGAVSDEWRPSDEDVAPVKRRRATAGGGDDDGSLESDGSSDDDESYSGSDSGSSSDELMSDDEAEFDDVDEELYQARLRKYQRSLGGRDPSSAAASPAGTASGRRQPTAAAAVAAGANGTAGGAADAANGAADDAATAAEEDVVFDGGFKVPGRIYSRLFDYQRTGVKWLWELHTQRAGGIIGDEMGLGKTIQVIAFLAGLHHSGLFRPTLVVCPATVLRQWMRELRCWYPPFRAVLFHDSGRSPFGSTRPKGQALVELVAKSPTGVLLTTYEQLRIHREELLPVRWGCVVLDEGHKIRNPDSEITLVCKQVQTVHRIIMTGSPIQNRLAELWSLFDFIFPGKLGTLPVFLSQFALPITVGGYANASQLQVSTAYKCAVVLRDLISPYLLRRRKADVLTSLPSKTEQVLFCRLTHEQRQLYRAYLSTGDVAEILEGKRQALAGIDILRKLCNHPDLLERATTQGSADYGNPDRSGKLEVTKKVLAHWAATGHKVLLFTQTQQMLDILEKLALAEGYSYHRMDGNTSIAQRSRLMDDFNNDPTRFLFLLTTKVGGLGVNLTGADRVLIYDPDWNPSTDIQARERAWRIGQSRPVTIYRLITQGTIEEKVYHRQIYKNYLTNKVLRDPRQKRFFTARDMSDLFTLGDDDAPPMQRTGAGAAAAPAAAATRPTTETARIFRSVGVEVPLEASTSGRGASAGTAAGAATAGGRGGRARGPQATKRAAQRQQQEQPQHEQGRQRQRGGGTAAQQQGQQHGRQGQQEQQEQQGQQGEDESGVLRDLFEGSGLHSLMDHSAIESANDPETLAVQHEASRIAQRAAEALRRSRQAIAGSDVATPTWTGHHGSAGAPSATRGRGSSAQRRFGTVTNRRLAAGPSSATGTAGAGAVVPGAGVPSRTPSPVTARQGASVAASPAGGAAAAGPSAPGVMGRSASGGILAGGAAPRGSSALLAQMRARQSAAIAAGSANGHDTNSRPDAAGPSHQAPSPSPSPSPSQQHQQQGDEAADLLAAQLVSFLESRGGEAPSDVLVDAFQEQVPPARMPLFKALLKRVAVLSRRTGSSVWSLRPDYNPSAAGGGGMSS